MPCVPEEAPRAPVAAYLGLLTVAFDSQTDYGISFRDILSGVPIPERGVRLDVAVSGTMSGSRLGGRVQGIDYIEVRPGHQVTRHLHLSFFTDAGGRVAASGEGVVTPTATIPITDVRVALLCRSNTAQTAWIDGQTIWAVGELDPFDEKVSASLYLAAG